MRPPSTPTARSTTSTSSWATCAGRSRRPATSTARRRGSSSSSRPTQKSAWVTCRLDFYKIPQFMKQFPFAHTITMTYRVSDGALEVHTRLDNLSNEPMPVVIGYHPIFELPDGNRNDWTVSVDAKTHWIEIPQRLPTGETQPIENFFSADRHGDPAQELRAHRRRLHRSRARRGRPRDDEADVQRQGAGRDPRAEVQDRAAVVDAARWWRRRAGGGRARRRARGGGRRPAAGPPARHRRPSGPFPVDPAQGVKVGASGGAHPRRRRAPARPPDEAASSPSSRWSPSPTR